MDRTLADEVIDFAEIHVLGVRPLSEWQRWLIRQVYAEPLVPLRGARPPVAGLIRSPGPGAGG
jgi:hypothetical protein